MARKGKNTIEIYKSWCKRCGICVAFCPAEALAQDESGNVYVKDPERCTGCQLCEWRCPDFAIHVRKAAKQEEKSPEGTTEKAKEETYEETKKT
jgi:2-oxoglutarate ferredoxin oxidoreductase subunit delta